MKKEVRVQTDPQTGDYFLALEDFSDIVDVSKVVYYELMQVGDEKDKGLIVKFFDADKNEIKLK